MRSKILKSVLFLSIVVGLASISFAQGGAGAEAAPPSTDEMIAQGEAIVQSGTALSTTVQGLIREATDDGDVMKVTCLNDKLTEIDGNVGSAQTHLGALRNAADAGVRAHEHTMLMVVGQKLDTLGQEAGQCVGQDLYETGETTVDTVVDTDMLPFEDNVSVPPTVLPPSLPTVEPPESGIM